MCLAQGPQRSDAGEARTRYPSVSSQALYHWATALPLFLMDLNFVTDKCLTKWMISQPMSGSLVSIQNAVKHSR